MGEEELIVKRNYLVVKSNALIQKTRYSLSLQEQKIILYLISKIKAEDDDFKEYDFDLKDLCAVCGIEYNGKNYKNFKESIKSLRDKSFWIETDSEDMLCSWVTGARIYKNDTRVKLSLDNKLKPYLLQLRQSFTSYELEHTLVMKSKYSIRLYEILKSYSFQGEYTVGVEEIKAILDTAEYKVYNNLKTKVIDKAIQEINAYTDLEVTFKPIRTGRIITSLSFSIAFKSSLDRTLTMLSRAEELDKKGM